MLENFNTSLACSLTLMPTFIQIKEEPVNYWVLQKNYITITLYLYEF